MDDWLSYNVEDCDEGVDIDPNVVTIYPFNQLHHYVTMARTADFMAVVVKILPWHTFYTGGKDTLVQELIVIDQSRKPFILTLWEDFVTYEATEDMRLGIGLLPIIIVNRIRVYPYKVISLSTRPGCVIMFNRPLPDAITLKEWYVT